MDPIATYTERLVNVRREFSLYRDHVDVHARWLLRGEYRSTIKLAGLMPEPRELRIRQKWFRYASWAIAIGLMILAVAVYPKIPSKMPPLGWAGIGIACAGAILASLTYPKIRFVRFDPAEGRGGLDIAKAGPQAGEFDDFVRKVGREIRKQRSRGAAS